MINVLGGYSRSTISDMDVDTGMEATLTILNGTWKTRKKNMCGFDKDDYEVLKKHAEEEKKGYTRRREGILGQICYYSKMIAEVDSELERVDRTLDVCNEQLEKDSDC